MTKPIITVTLNPAIDETITLDDLHPGQVHRARSVRFNAGGKGVNVASCLADWGLPVIATGVLGDANDSVFKTLFAAKRITDRFSRTTGDTRVNIKLVHNADTTDINLPGLRLTPDKLSELTDTVLGLAGSDSLVVLGGSVPAGLSDGLYRELIAALATRGARVLLDTSGAPLTAALGDQARHLPDCVKPNRAELEAWIGHPLPDMASVAVAARALVARGIPLVVVSLGEKGALFATDAQVLLATSPVVACASTVGAGDAMVAGIVAALHEKAPLEDIARLATAFAVGKLGLPGPNLPSRAEIEARAAKVHIAILT
ncbi:MAG TPA: 1-phosphofructokinase [Telmatospirillum sp.]|nr:1-phosphofructokinase [Telmatospirillum sp.]